MGERELSVNEQLSTNPPQEPEPGQASEAVPEVVEPARADQVETVDLATRVQELIAERDRLAAEVQMLKDQLLRQRADFDNFRKRVERERNEILEFAAAETIKQLLPTLDDLERAVRAAPAGEGPLQDYVAGIQMIYQRLMDVLTRLGLEPIESVGRPFDPTVHHAVDMVTTDEAEDHTVIEEYRKGYNFKGKLLREALVKVALKPKPSS